jgi:chromosome segregation ATPase
LLAIIQADEKKMDTSVKQMKVAITNFEKRIADETAKMEAATQGKREEVTRKLDQAKANVAAAERHHSDICSQHRQKQSELTTQQERGEAAQARITKLKQDIQQAENRLSGCMKQEKDSLAPYGNNIKGVLEEIAKTKWHGDVLGPLGIHVRVKDQQWAHILRMQLGHHMYLFNVTDSRDQPRLKELFRRTGKYVSLPVVVSVTHDAQRPY